MKKYNFVYKTTHKASGNYYIGVHSTDKLEDGYLGSGKRLWNSIRKHGKEAFEREILKQCNSREDAYALEKELVTKELLKDTLCMNLSLGGSGDFYKKPTSEETKEKQSVARKGKPGRKHTEEHKAHMSKILKGMPYKGGSRMWVTDGVLNKFILKNDLIPEGWRRGRTKKNTFGNTLGKNNGMFGKKQSEETKKKISKTKTKR